MLTNLCIDLYEIFNSKTQAAHFVDLASFPLALNYS